MKKISTFVITNKNIFNMTIDELLLQFNESDIQEILNDVPGKTLVKFNGNYFYADCEDGIIQFLTPVRDKIAISCM